MRLHDHLRTSSSTASEIMSGEVEQLSVLLPPTPPPLPPLKPLNIHERSASSPHKLDSLPKHEASPFSRAAQRPESPAHELIYYFFYGTLTKPDVLQGVLDLMEEPQLHKAKVVGYSLSSWGQYKALIKGKPGEEVSGYAFEVQSIDQAHKLAYYETNAYRLAPCTVQFEDGTRVLGKTFMYAGDSQALQQGRFDRVLWEMQMGINLPSTSTEGRSWSNALLRECDDSTQVIAMADNGRSATDIITYIGVPLAVLGVLPILYNTFATLASLSRIRRMLRHNRLTALTRGDVVNRIIEIELPRYAVMPLDRFHDGSEYWTLSRNPSSLPGGSWTKFNWKINTIGMKTQRVEYADQIRQPQVEVAFEELACYLLDLGAVPDPQGWKLLRSSGLWSPVGCSLMKSPDGLEKALTIAPLHDSDGHLSLAVNWSHQWMTRDNVQLPPYWVRLPAPAPKPSKPASTNDGDKTKDTDKTMASIEGNGESSSQAEVDSIEHEGRDNAQSDVMCQISIGGLTTALIQGNNPRSLYIDHLRITSGKSDGVWFASAATAYGTSSQTILWNYKIPADVLSFSRQDTIPCGILVLLNMVDESETPQWSTSYNDHGAMHEQYMQRNRASQQAMQAEARMAPAQREEALRDRSKREMDQRMQDLRDKMRQDQHRRDQRSMEALQSPKWNTNQVAEHSLKWLKARDIWDSVLTNKAIVGYMLQRMALDGEFASSIFSMLDTWKAWAEIGGLRSVDLQNIRDNQTVFAQAALLVGLIRDSADTLDGTLAMDLQECLRMWKTVRLG